MSAPFIMTNLDPTGVKVYICRELLLDNGSFVIIKKLSGLKHRQAYNSIMR